MRAWRLCDRCPCSCSGRQSRRCENPSLQVELPYQKRIRFSMLIPQAGRVSRGDDRKLDWLCKQSCIAPRGAGESLGSNSCLKRVPIPPGGRVIGGCKSPNMGARNQNPVLYRSNYHSKPLCYLFSTIMIYLNRAFKTAQNS